MKKIIISFLFLLTIGCKSTSEKAIISLKENINNFKEEVQKVDKNIVKIKNTIEAEKKQQLNCSFENIENSINELENNFNSLKNELEVIDVEINSVQEIIKLELQGYKNKYKQARNNFILCFLFLIVILYLFIKSGLKIKVI